MALLSYRGTRDEPLPDDWYANEPDLIGGFGVTRSRQPEIGIGEGVIWYATRWGRVFGVARVIAEPVCEEHRPGKEVVAGRGGWQLSPRWSFPPCRPHRHCRRPVLETFSFTPVTTRGSRTRSLRQPQPSCARSLDGVPQRAEVIERPSREALGKAVREALANTL